jgi:glutaminyl-peptide cyclotransferase
MLPDWFTWFVAARRRLWLAWLAALCLLAGCSAVQPPAAKVCRYEVVNTFPHDPGAFTQGLEYFDGQLYESTGLYGRSSIRRVELETGKVLQQAALPWKYFGEGITLWNGKLIQLTWQSRIGFIYDRASFRRLSSFAYPTEGWGLTHDARGPQTRNPASGAPARLIMSDGSDTLFFRDPETFAETGRLRVTDRGAPVSNLNELEFIHGEIWANIWPQDRIARISPVSGQVLSWVDLSGLLPLRDRWWGPQTPYFAFGVPFAGALNGIAYDAKADRIFVTGKQWPKLFEIRISAK